MSAPPENCPGTESEAAGRAAACAGCPNQVWCPNTLLHSDTLSFLAGGVRTGAQGPRPRRGGHSGADAAHTAQGVAATSHCQRSHTHTALGGRCWFSLARAASARALSRRSSLLRWRQGASRRAGPRQTFCACQGSPHSLSLTSTQVGLLDIDICGPSLPRMLGLEGEEVHQSSTGWSPVYVSDNLGVMSIGFMLADPNEAVVWRGPRKNGLIKQFLKDVEWGTLDFLVCHLLLVAV